MARIIKTDIENNYSGLDMIDAFDFSKIKITPSIISLAISPILLTVTPLKNLAINMILAWNIYSLLKQYEK